jgi:hypothetical protein
MLDERVSLRNHKFYIGIFSFSFFFFFIEKKTDFELIPFSTMAIFQLYYTIFFFRNGKFDSRRVCARSTQKLAARKHRITKGSDINRNPNTTKNTLNTTQRWKTTATNNVNSRKTKKRSAPKQNNEAAICKTAQNQHRSPQYKQHTPASNLLLLKPLNTSSLP